MLCPAARHLALAAEARPPLPALCRLSTDELLAAPVRAPRAAVDLAAELEALAAAATGAVRRRPGWLKVFPCTGPLPAAVPPRLLQAAVLSIWSAALRADVPAALGCRACGGAAVLWAAGGRPRGAAAALPARLAAVGGGALLYTANAPFTALWRLPASALPQRTAARAEDLLGDRWSFLYQYLAGFCAAPDL